MAICGVALGGNIGDTISRFNQALARLEAAGCQIRGVSDYLSTAPMGAASGDHFLNAAAVIETLLTPQQLLEQLHLVERALGRQRTVHWGPRTLDLDLLWYDDDVIDSSELVLPHPCLWYRRFVLQPLREIAPDWKHPLLGETTDQLYQRLQCRPLLFEISFHQNWGPSRDQLERRFSQEIMENKLTLREAEEQSTISAETFARLVQGGKAATSQARTQPTNQPTRQIQLFFDRNDTKAALVAAQDIFTAALG